MPSLLAWARHAERIMRPIKRLLGELRDAPINKFLARILSHLYYGETALVCEQRWALGKAA